MKVNGKGEPLKNPSTLVYALMSCAAHALQCSTVHVCLTHWPSPPGVPNEDFRKFSEYANLPKEMRYVALHRLAYSDGCDIHL